MKTLIAFLFLFAITSPALAGEGEQEYTVRLAFKNTTEYPVHVFLHPKYAWIGNDGVVAIADPLLNSAHRMLGKDHPNPFRPRPITNLPVIPPRPSISIGPENSGFLTFKERGGTIHFCFQVDAGNPLLADAQYECHLAHFTLDDLPGRGKALLFTIRGIRATLPPYRESSFSVVRVAGHGRNRPKAMKDPGHLLGVVSPGGVFLP